MSNETKFFPRAYGIKTQVEINSLYSDWAETYDHELLENGYETPMRVARALSAFLPLNSLILDFGCGTGLSGKALKNINFTNVHGTEINQNMLDKAELTSVYQSLILGSQSNPFDFEKGKYQAITAVGVISSGAGPAKLIRSALNALNSDGLFALSLNDAALADPEYTGEIQYAIDQGIATLLSEEYGPYMSTKGIGATVYVLKRL
jgi:predicted TPR repeat methyltransferase